MPASGSKSQMVHGAGDTAATQRSTRSGRSAAVARLCGPPPEPPLTTNRSRPSASAIAATSGTTSATERPGRRDESPYPARSNVIRRIPWRASIDRSSGYEIRLPGVPWWTITGRPAGSPHSANARTRPPSSSRRCSRWSGITAGNSRRPPYARSMRTKAEQIATIKADQQFWRDLVAEVGPDRYAEPGPMGEWTFGDMAGHLLGWRNRTIARLEAHARGEPEPPPIWPAELDDDEVINDWLHDNDKGRPPSELVAAYDASYDRLIRALAEIPEATGADPEAFAWVGGPLVELTFTGHLHDEHVPGVRAWLDRGKG